MMTTWLVFREIINMIILVAALCHVFVAVYHSQKDQYTKATYSNSAAAVLILFYIVGKMT